MNTIDHARAQGKAADLSALEADWLLLHCLERPTHDRAWLLSHGDQALTPQQQQAWLTALERRRQGEPLAYITGLRGFYGLELHVDARVLDPRPDTETLVTWAIESLASLATPTVLDLGTGSGAIALAIQSQRPSALVYALDRSADALAVARLNAQRLGLAVLTAQNHWLSSWPPADAPAWPTTFDLIVSNPPYIPEQDAHLASLMHEPLSALASGPDGLDDLRTIIAQAPRHLQRGGWLLLEHGWDQGEAVAQLLHHHGYIDVAHRQDLAGHCRCTGARRPS